MTEADTIESLKNLIKEIAEDLFNVKMKVMNIDRKIDTNEDYVYRDIKELNDRVNALESIIANS